jgi:hypothetical protein
MFLSYDHLQAGIYTPEINSIDNGSFVFRILVNLVDNGNRFLVTVYVVAVGKVTIAYCCRELSTCCYMGNIDFNQNNCQRMLLILTERKIHL